MTIVKCKECGKKVSTTASACPSCGAPNFIPTEPKKTSKIVKYGGSFVLIVVLAPAILSAIGSKPSNNPLEANARATGAAIRAIARDPDSVKIERMLITPDGKTRCVQYQAKNGFGGTVREFVIVFEDHTSKQMSDWNTFCPDSLTDYANYAR